MIWRSREPRYDVASGISQGARDYQEDAITADFPVGAEAGFVVLADGMGGHAAGDVASKVVLTEVYSELKFHYADVEAFEARAPEILRSVANLANETLRQHAETHPETDGMGATLVVPALVENRLWWISIGDSPLFLYRNGRLSQLNEDHSMAPQIDFMVQAGLLDAEAAVNHPDRNCLVSVLMGSKIAKIDCPAQPYELKAGDIVICSSDGLQFLTNLQIEKVLAKYRKTRSTEIAERLLEELARLGDPDQDNISFTVIKVNDASVRPKQNRPPRQSLAVNRPRGLTMVVTEPVLVPLPGPQEQPAADEAPAAAGIAAPADPVAAEPSALEAALAAAEDGAPAPVVPRRFAALG
ncbi:protein phosphatase 2C domain-containing protein [Tabrizicola sp.]|uniref:PP2C family protein-serine/threonine phosphatase n=1 Tax=Tabrizicola sp. TaxID=2005166 RepID=UPI0026014AF0|nr:protein phosphatase 2C domain-containing protein [Tabrizicola sp.]